MTSKELNDKIVALLRDYNFSAEQIKRSDLAAAAAVRKDDNNLKLIRENGSIEARAQGAVDLIEEYMYYKEGGKPVSYKALFNKLRLGGLFKPNAGAAGNMREFDEATAGIMLPGKKQLETFKTFITHVRQNIEPYLVSLDKAQNAHLTATLQEYTLLVDKGKVKRRHGKR